MSQIAFYDTLCAQCGEVAMRQRDAAVAEATKEIHANANEGHHVVVVPVPRLFAHRTGYSARSIGETILGQE
jgi:hypothetical protein